MNITTYTINEFTLQANFIINKLVISKAGLRSAGDGTEGQNAFTPSQCFAQISPLKDSQNTRD